MSNSVVVMPKVGFSYLKRESTKYLLNATRKPVYLMVRSLDNTYFEVYELSTKNSSLGIYPTILEFAHKNNPYVVMQGNVLGMEINTIQGKKQCVFYLMPANQEFIKTSYKLKMTGNGISQEELNTLSAKYLATVNKQPIKMSKKDMMTLNKHFETNI